MGSEMCIRDRISTDQQKRGMRSKDIPKTRKLEIVLIKLTAPKIEEAPAK